MPRTKKREICVDDALSVLARSHPRTRLAFAYGLGDFGAGVRRIGGVRRLVEPRPARFDAFVAAAGEIALRNSMCDYFPSYEIITGGYNRGAYFESDLRSVKADGVDHVMRLFLSHYVGDNPIPEPAGTSNSSAGDIRKELAITNEIICDEEAVDPLT